VATDYAFSMYYHIQRKKEAQNAGK
jgi:hypothetical protein